MPIHFQINVPRDVKQFKSSILKVVWFLKTVLHYTKKWTFNDVIPKYPHYLSEEAFKGVNSITLI